MVKSLLIPQLEYLELHVSMQLANAQVISEAIVNNEIDGSYGEYCKPEYWKGFTDALHDFRMMLEGIDIKGEYQSPS